MPDNKHTSSSEGSPIQPIIGITLGDPTGIGPEIIAGALLSRSVHQSCFPIVLGRPAILRRAMDLIGSDQEIRVIHSLDRETTSKLFANMRIDFLRGETTPREVLCFECGSPDADAATIPRIDARGGAAAHASLIAATRAAIEKNLDSIVTAPLHKAALHAAGHVWPGHTELLAYLCGVSSYAMMLYLPPGKPGRGGPAGLGVIHVTLHVAMRQIFDLLTPEAIFDKIQLSQIAFERLRSSMDLPTSPSLAVAALNPHAGESGLFGDEESRVIAPAVERAREHGWNVTGPLSVDTLMPLAVDGKYDAVVAMYHDQGHIALKLLDMFDAVNITLGLPIIRTSVAHGTAHDIAWQGKAKCSGMIQAILTAARLKGMQHGF